MIVLRALESLFKRRPRDLKSVQKQPRRRLEIECLEDRSLLSPSTVGQIMAPAATAAEARSPSTPVAGQAFDFIKEFKSHSSEAPLARASDFSIYIDWDDEQSEHASAYATDGIPPFAFVARHTYASGGTYTISTTITERPKPGEGFISPWVLLSTVRVEGVLKPYAPTNLKAKVTCAEIELTWNASAGASGYHVFRGVGNGWSQIGAPGAGINRFTVTGLTPGTAYRFSVSAYDQLGGTMADPITATTAYRPVTVGQLRAIMPEGLTDDGKAQKYADALNEAMQAFGITTPARQSAFLAQIAQETSHCRYLNEAGWLSTPKRAAYFNTTYAKRKDIWDPPNHVDFTGRGQIQLTGRGNYQAATNALRPLGYDFVKNPDLLVTDPQASALAAAWYWKNHSGYPTVRRWVPPKNNQAGHWTYGADLAHKASLNSLADDLSVNSFLQVGIGVNGFNSRTGLPNGWPSRVANYKAALAALFLGVRINPTTGKVISIIPNGSGEKAGIQSGDILNQLGGNSIRTNKVLSLPGLLDGLRGQTNGSLSLGLLRAGKPFTAQISLFDGCCEE